MDFDPAVVAVIFTSLVFSLTIHEAAHAAMAYYCGDDTAKHMGRLSLNPLVHVDLMGTVILPLLLLTTTGFMFGWAKPVPFVPRNLNNPTRDPVLIAMAGPASNLLLALLAAFAARAIIMAVGLDNIDPMLSRFLGTFILLNLILMIFNLIPVPPLDGHYVLNYFLPPAAQDVMQKIGPFGILIAILVARPVIQTALPPMRDLVGRIIGA
jgi:Zn-dependent protease